MVQAAYPFLEMLPVLPWSVGSTHRRRMEREAKAKVMASFFGEKFIQFLAAGAVLPRSSWKKRLKSTVSSKST